MQMKKELNVRLCHFVFRGFILSVWRRIICYKTLSLAAIENTAISPEGYHYHANPEACQKLDTPRVEWPCIQ